MLSFPADALAKDHPSVMSRDSRESSIIDEEQFVDSNFNREGRHSQMMSHSDNIDQPLVHSRSENPTTSRKKRLSRDHKFAGPEFDLCGVVVHIGT